MNRNRHHRPLATLLDAQPRTLVRDPRHRLMWDLFMASPRLQRLRISPRCYRLLDRASVPPDGLNAFRRTYRLPDDPFFALFLAIKRNWLDERRRVLEKRRDAIHTMFDSLPKPRLEALGELRRVERLVNAAGTSPEWDANVYPGTKKRVAEYGRYPDDEWWGICRGFLDRLVLRYARLNRDQALRIEALIEMGFQGRWPDDLPASAEVADRYRLLAKARHPDRGGSPAAFRRLKAARDCLTSG